jgi:hypothetical protein
VGVPVAVAVMQIGEVRMPMHQRQVPMQMRVRLARRVVRTVAMLVMLVVGVPVLVLHRFVNMLMLMSFGEMEPQAQRHQPAGQQQFSG